MPRSRLHFGVLLSSIEEHCQSEIWQGIQKGAVEHGVDLTVYLSTFQQKTGVVAEHYGMVYDAIRTNQALDGLIILAGFIVEDTGDEPLRAFIESMRHLPMVTIAGNYPSIPGLGADNRQGIYAAVSHLIEHHNRTRIAFVKGPDGHGEAEERLAGYRKALLDHGIQIDPRYELPGHFSVTSGADAVTDDSTATGVLAELERQGILVPAEVSVTGFDDDWSAEIVVPSLTTVHQPFEDMGTASIVELLNLVKKRPVAEVLCYPPAVIIRQSCGCIDETGYCIPHNSVIDETTESLLYRTALPLLTPTVPEQIAKEWLTLLASILEAPTFNRKKFLSFFDGLLIHYRRYGNDFKVWQQILTVLIDAIESICRIDITRLPDLLRALNESVLLISRSQTRDHRFETRESTQKQWDIRGISQEIVTSFDYRDLTEKLREAADELSIRTMLISLFDKPVPTQNWLMPTSLMPLICFSGKKVFAGGVNAKRFTFSDLSKIPDVDLPNDRTTMFFMPLFFGSDNERNPDVPTHGELLGVLMLEYAESQPIDLYESLRISIATAMKGAALIREVQTLSITDELTGIYNRRGFKHLSVSRLAQLRRSGRGAALFFADMDGLKAINDKFGHAAGDDAIAACASLLKNTFREEDVLGRMGGDEFTVFAINLEAKDLPVITRRIRKSFTRWNAENLRPWTLACSVGGVLLEDYSNEGFEKMLLKADKLLYEEKRKKRENGIGRQ